MEPRDDRRLGTLPRHADPAPAPAPGLLALAVRVVGIALAYFVSFALAVFVLPPSDALQAANDRLTAGEPTILILFGYSLLVALAVAYPVVHARVGGWRLATGLFVSFYGFITFMSQIETAWFLDAFPLIDDGEMVRLFLRGGLASLVFIPFSAWLLRRWIPCPADAGGLPRIAWRTWARRAPLLAVAYAVLYFLFGYFVAWQFAEVRQFYSGSTTILDFVPHLLSVTRTDPGLFAFQLLRGLLWIPIAAPILVLVRGRKEAAVSLALLLTAFGAQILIPSALFPPNVRYVHCLETVTSTALFGVLLAWTLPVTRAPREGALVPTAAPAS